MAIIQPVFEVYWRTNVLVDHCFAPVIPLFHNSFTPDLRGATKMDACFLSYITIEAQCQRTLRSVRQLWIPKISSVQLFFVSIIGEYVGAIHTQVLKRPLVIEKEWINFDWMIGAIQDCYLLLYLRIEF